MAVSSRRIRPEDWKPVGVKALEANALKVARSRKIGPLLRVRVLARQNCSRSAPPFSFKLMRPHLLGAF